VICKIWYLISRTASEDDAHRGNNDDRSVGAFAVKPRAFGAPLAALGLDRSARPSSYDATLLEVVDDAPTDCGLSRSRSPASGPGSRRRL